MNFNAKIGQLIKKHFLCSFERVEIYIFAPIKRVTKNKDSINVGTCDSRKKCLIIKFFIVIQKVNGIISSAENVGQL
jgi:hypothetical protein